MLTSGKMQFILKLSDLRAFLEDSNNGTEVTSKINKSTCTFVNIIPF